MVTKLLNICEPHRAYFGEKDAQQLAVIKHLVRDLDMRVEIVSCPIVRERDGLAMSSRNARLTAQERSEAPVLYRSLLAAKELVQSGERDPGVLKGLIRSVLAEARLGEVDYVDIVRADDLTSVMALSGECLMALAVCFGHTRLIDNISVRV